MPKRQIVNLDPIELSYLEWPGQEPVLLLHGLADNACVWLSLGEALAGTYQVLAPDMRGHGESSKPETGYTFLELIADLEGLMAARGWSSAHVIGHSWTGKLAAIWARYHPERLRSLVLVDPIFIWKMPEVFRLTFPLLYRTLPFLKSMGPFSSYAVAEAQAKGLKQFRGWSDLQRQVFEAGIEQKSEGCWGSKFTVPARNGIFADVMRVAGLTEVLEIPSLLILPEQGFNRFNWQIESYPRYLQNLEVARVPGNHWPFLGEPEAFNHIVIKFLEGVGCRV